LLTDRQTDNHRVKHTLLLAEFVMNRCDNLNYLFP